MEFVAANKSASLSAAVRVSDRFTFDALSDRGLSIDYRRVLPRTTGGRLFIILPPKEQVNAQLARRLAVLVRLESLEQRHTNRAINTWKEEAKMRSEFLSKPTERR